MPGSYSLVVSNWSRFQPRALSATWLRRCWCRQRSLYNLSRAFAPARVVDNIFRRREMEQRPLRTSGSSMARTFRVRDHTGLRDFLNISRWQNLGTYNLVASNITGVTVSTNVLLTIGPVACWGRNTSGQCLPPAGLTNVVGIAGAADYSVSVQSDGSLTSWTPAKPTTPVLTNAVAVSAGASDQGHALMADGTIVGWGSGTFGTGFTNGVPAGIGNVVALRHDGSGSLFLRSDGTVGAIPLGSSPTGLTKVVAIAAGVNNQNLALRSDGTVVEWSASLAAAGTSAITNPVPGLSNVCGNCGRICTVFGFEVGRAELSDRGID